MHFLIAAAIMGSFVHMSPVPAADRLIDEKRSPGQSDYHGRCMAKVLDSAVRAVAVAPVRVEAHPLEDTHIVVLAKPGATSLTIDFFRPDTKEWGRIAASCEEETFVQRSYLIDRPASIEPPAPNMRELRRHVMQTYPSQDQCVADLLATAFISLGATAFQEESDRNGSEQMRLIFSDGATRTEMSRQDTGMWVTTTGTCVNGRETVVDRTTAVDSPTSK